jgi:hypothetical protein
VTFIKSNGQIIRMRARAMGYVVLVFLWPRWCDELQATEYRQCGLPVQLEDSGTGAEFYTQCKADESIRNQDEQCIKAMTNAAETCTSLCFDEPSCGARKDFQVTSETRDCRQAALGDVPLTINWCKVEAICTCGRR